MRSATYKELSRDALTKVITAYGQEAYTRLYRIDDDQTVYVTVCNSRGHVVLTKIGEDPDTVDVVDDVEGRNA